MTRALVPLAAGVEEMEAVIVIDTLRRAGWTVVSVAVGSQPIVASRGVRLLADAVWDEIDPSGFDVLVLPGGSGGTDVLKSDPRILAAVRDFVAGGKLLGAICAAPLVLQAASVLHGRRATCHPGVAVELTDAIAVNDRVVVDGNILTSQGPGTAIEFALALIREADGQPAAAAVAGPMCV